MRIITFLILSGLGSFAFGEDQITLNTWIKVEQGAFDAKSVALTITNENEVISTIYYDGFQSQISNSQKGRYYVNTNQALYGNTRLGYGLNIIRLEFRSLTSQSTQSFEVTINEEI